MKINKLSDWKYSFSISGLDNPLASEWSVELKTDLTRSTKSIVFGVKDGVPYGCSVSNGVITVAIDGDSLDAGACYMTPTTITADSAFTDNKFTSVGLKQYLYDSDNEKIILVDEQQ